MEMVKVRTDEVIMDIKVNKLTGQNFNKFGESIFVAKDLKPDNEGDGWKCWYPLSEINRNNDFSFGIVLSKPKYLGTQFMERHLDRDEYVIALDHPIIQIVGMSNRENNACPDITLTEAYLINPGQMVKINPGVWHSAAIASQLKSCLYLFLLGKPTKETKFVDSGLVQFASGDQLIIS
jgi:ureidoglycolate hydrolase